MMRIKEIIFCSLILSVLVQGGNTYIVPLMKKIPKIDGYINEDEWEESIRFDGFIDSGNKLDLRKCIGFIGATDEKIYISIISEMPQNFNLISEVKQNSEEIIYDDNIEVWIDPYPENEIKTIYKMICNSIGYVYYSIFQKVKDESKVLEWAGGCRIKNGIHNKMWHCEIEIPIKNIEKNRKITDGNWKINIVRNFKQPWTFTSIGSEFNNFISKNDNVFKFSNDKGIIVKEKHLKDPFLGNIYYVCELYNPLKKEIKANVNISIKRFGNVEGFSKKEEIILLPGEKKEVIVDKEDSKEYRFVLETSIQNIENNEVFFSRGPIYWKNFNILNWKERDEKWINYKKEIPGADFIISYYPYLNKIKIFTSIANILEKDGKVEKVRYKIINIETQREEISFYLGIEEFKNGLCEKIFDLPHLMGRYKITMQIIGKNIPEGEVIKYFERKSFEWEHNNLGKSRKVYPPFIPIKKEGNKLYTVLKEYAVNNIGLLSSIITEDQQGINKKEILAGEIKYKGKIDGKEENIEKSQLIYKEISEDRIIMESNFKIGKLEINSISFLDYDGMLKVDLTINPCDVRVDELTLEIPIKNDVATLMHAMSTDIRDPILTTYVPPGEGLIWDSNKLPPTQFNRVFPSNFCTYIYVGNEHRGISWFCENDKGWSRDEKKPNLQIVREKDVLKIQINLINKPIIITKPQTITFGILAAPVKPKLKGWRYRWVKENFGLVATDSVWFGYPCCGSVYPLGKDTYIFEILGKANRREKITEEEMKIFKEKLKKYSESLGKEQGIDRFLGNSMEVKLNIQRNIKNTIFYYNRATFPAAEEFQTFMDEWALKEYNNHYRPYGIWELGVDGVWEEDIVPTESYIDFAVWWYKKAIELANASVIYWDNYFFIPSTNTMTTSAYKKEDGTIMSSTGLWGLRELVKRTFIMMNELGKEPFTMVHMTSTQILPLYSFATIQLDLEWKYSKEFMQNKFPREYLRLVSSGDLPGTWPMVIGDEQTDKKAYIGVSIIHDIIDRTSQWYKQYRKPFIDMAEKGENLIVYRYWDERQQPIYTKNPDLPGIVYCIPGKESLYGVVSYLKEDTEDTVFIHPEILKLNKYKVIDMETNQEIPVENNTFKLKIKKYDFKVFKVVEIQ
ncbi:MAG TPA: hypothetical protein PKV21_06620 [bacterium]|nr:hypothetical protein [bacterium]HOM27163.1 hypothetical protein [bacterium]